MTELSQEDRDRIYAEEKARKEAQDRLKKEEAQAKSKNVRMGCLGLIALIVVIGFFMSQLPPEHPSTPSAPAAESKPALQLNPDWKFEDTSGSVYIVGIVTNNSQKQYGYVQISFNLYDKSKAQVGTAFANINNLEPGGTWKFKALVLEKNVAQAKLKDLTGF